MQKRTIKTKEEARQYAMDWQNWVADQDLSWEEISKWESELEDIATEFGLTEEFKENGII
jgi:hypothetical protein